MFKKSKTDVGIELAMIRDQFRLGKKLEQINAIAASKQRNGDSASGNSCADNKVDNEIKTFEQQLKRSIDKRAERHFKGDVHFPEALPVSQKVNEIKALVAQHQVIVLGGETGSGKSTQVPKICLELGLSEGGMIAHTQPRRIAARSLSQRIQEELAQTNKNLPNNFVACKVRFSDNVSEQTHIKLMTDGMLLAEIEQDPFLEQYQCIILDEVHERTLNIDFLLAFLKRLLKKREDLKLILTSATIDLNKISRHFERAPIIEVSGRNYPVDMIYLEPGSDFDSGEQDDELNLIQAVDYLLGRSRGLQASGASGKSNYFAQDMLVFLATEKNIRLQSSLLRKYFKDELEILPLYGRMPLSQQRKVFSEPSKRRRIVLATNVAETSITVPNIGFVIDTGLARISRYRSGSKVQQLPIEKISQASAQQRAGRCGRIAPGVCMRLYSEQDFNQRAAYTEPEIQRTNLSSVLLKMASLKLGKIENFPLLDKPDKRLIKDARKVLFELEAFDKAGALTGLGKRMASLSIDPKFARILLEASKRDCLQELLIIVTGLSVNDPRLRPREQQQIADEKHRQYIYPDSDFISYLNLWQVIEQKRQDLSRNQFKRFCAESFLSFNHINEWRELHFQLRLQLRRLGLVLAPENVDKWQQYETASTKKTSEEAFLYQQIHKSILKGCLSNIAHLDEGFSYQAANHKQLFIFPSSALFKSKVPWMVCGALIETSKLFAHNCARIESEWVLEQGEHVISRHYFEAFWSKRKGSVQVYRQSSYRGLVLEAKKAVRADKQVATKCRDDLNAIFILGALVEKGYNKPPSVIKHNWQVLEQLYELENKSRGVYQSPGDDELLCFYQERIPADISDVRSFEQWLKSQAGDTLKISRDSFSGAEFPNDFSERFPDQLSFGELSLDCQYVFNPGAQHDGLNLSIPYQQLNQLNEQQLEWLVPGLLKEKCEALLRSLPKSLRKQCMPIPETVKLCLGKLNYGEGSLLEALSKAVFQSKGVNLESKDFDLSKLPAYLRPYIKAFDEQGQLLADGQVLSDLKASVKNLLSESDLLASSLTGQVETAQGFSPGQAIKCWDFGDIEPSLNYEKSFDDANKAFVIKYYQALQDQGDAVVLQHFDDEEEAKQCHRKGQMRLMALAVSQTKRELSKVFAKQEALPVKLFSAGKHKQIFDSLFDALIEQVFFTQASSCMQAASEALISPPILVYSQSAFNERLRRNKGRLYPEALALFDLLSEIAEQVFSLRQALAKPVSQLRRTHHDMVEAHLESLVRWGFLSDFPYAMLLRYPCYLSAMSTRLERLQGNIERDKQLNQHVEAYRKRILDLDMQSHRFTFDDNYRIQCARFILEEYSMHQFAQRLKPLKPASRKRLDSLLSALEQG